MKTCFDFDIVQKYDRPGPRYTSYPTANLFREDIGAEDLARTLREEPRIGEPLSLYVHAPFCKSLCWYCGCNMKVSHNRKLMDAHFDLILDEIDMVRPLVHPSRKAAQVHLGGGTPNYLRPEQLVTVVERLRERFGFHDDAEISIEIDPRLLSSAHLDAIARAGFNRVSIGVQDFEPAVQKAIHRENSYKMVRRCVNDLRAAGIQSVNMDLIYGLPLQTLNSFNRTLDQVLSLDPERIALFNFAYLPALKPQMKLIKPEDLPTPRQKMELLTTAVDRLEESGMIFIGIDHFAHPKDPLSQAWRDQTLHRNFQGYTTHAGLEMLGFGMSAISMMDGIYVQNHSKITDWEKSVRQGHMPTARGYVLSQDDKLRRGIINRLMCRYTIDIPLIESEVGEDFDTAFPGVTGALTAMQADGLIQKEGAVWRATRPGRFLLRNIAMLFDHHLARPQGRQANFSRTV
ncbi:MAG: oxygen-independent coproporphyrinogen III oxidase [Acidobacteriota bacterium]|nr:oxygen-independent coproporphyrinogen III oxidase [Acidobacteriota bacterium]